MEIDYGYPMGTHDGSNPYPSRRTPEEQLRAERDNARAQLAERDAEVEDLREELAETRRVRDAYESWNKLRREELTAAHNQLAERDALLSECLAVLYETGYAMTGSWKASLVKRIEAALGEGPDD